MNTPHPRSRQAIAETATPSVWQTGVLALATTGELSQGMLVRLTGADSVCCGSQLIRLLGEHGVEHKRLDTYNVADHRKRLLATGWQPANLGYVQRPAIGYGWLARTAVKAHPARVAWVSDPHRNANRLPPRKPGDELYYGRLWRVCHRKPGEGWQRTKKGAWNRWHYTLTPSGERALARGLAALGPATPSKSQLQGVSNWAAVCHGRIDTSHLWQVAIALLHPYPNVFNTWAAVAKGRDLAVPQLGGCNVSAGLALARHIARGVSPASHYSMLFVAECVGDLQTACYFASTGLWDQLAHSARLEPHAATLAAIAPDWLRWLWHHHQLAQPGLGHNWHSRADELPLLRAAPPLNTTPRQLLGRRPRVRRLGQPPASTIPYPLAANVGAAIGGQPHTLTTIRDEGELRLVAKRLKNCAASYHDQLAAAKEVLVVLRRAGSDKPLALGQLRAGKWCQIVGPCNAAADPDVAAAYRANAKRLWAAALTHHTTARTAAQPSLVPWASTPTLPWASLAG